MLVYRGFKQIQLGRSTSTTVRVLLIISLILVAFGEVLGLRVSLGKTLGTELGQD